MPKQEGCAFFILQIREYLYIFKVKSYPEGWEEKVLFLYLRLTYQMWITCSSITQNSYGYRYLHSLLMYNVDMYLGASLYHKKQCMQTLNVVIRVTQISLFLLFLVCSTSWLNLGYIFIHRVS